MRKVFTFIISLLFVLSYTARAQSDTSSRGIWYYLVNPTAAGTFAQQISLIKQSLHPKGVLVAISWSALQDIGPAYDTGNVGTLIIMIQVQVISGTNWIISYP